MELIAWFAPITVIACVILALRGTRLRRKDDTIPSHLIGMASSMRRMTNSERRWNLK